MRYTEANVRNRRVLGKLGGKLTFKSLGSFKKPKKMLEVVSSRMRASSIIDEIGGVNLRKICSFSYFHNKFLLIGTNMNLMSAQINAISQYMDAIDTRISSNRLSNIITSFVAFLVIAYWRGYTIYLLIRTTYSHFQKSLNKIMRAVSHMREQYKPKVRLVRAREDLLRMDANDVELERRIQTVQIFN